MREIPRPLTLPGGKTLDFRRVRIMGVLNVTPDSFSDGGRFQGVEDALAHGRALQRAGAHILDIGAESTRPGSEPVPPAEQLRRLLPVIAAVVAELDVHLSVDTTSSEVARRCLQEGAGMVNDISAFRFDPEMVGLLVETGAPGIAMHTLGRPADMQTDPRYGDVVEEVVAHLAERVSVCVAQGVRASQIILDPGFGFGKTLAHNLRLLHGLKELAALGHAVLVGPSRKRFLGEVTGRPVDDRERGTAAACALAVHLGAHMVRVHEPAAVRDAVSLSEALAQAAHADPSGVDFSWPPT